MLKELPLQKEEVFQLLKYNLPSECECYTGLKFLTFAFTGFLKNANRINYSNRIGMLKFGLISMNDN